MLKNVIILIQASNGHHPVSTSKSSKDSGPPCAKCKDSKNNGECCDTLASVNKVAHKLHQLELGQRKIIHLLTSIEKELSSREKNCCTKHQSINNLSASQSS